MYGMFIIFDVGGRRTNSSAVQTEMRHDGSCSACCSMAEAATLNRTGGSGDIGPRSRQSMFVAWRVFATGSSMVVACL